MFAEKIEGTRLYKDVQREAIQKMVLNLLRWRLNLELPAAMVTQIEQLSAEQLNSLAKALLDFVNLADLQNWLDENYS